jgi:undecaprenyl pyrophosphate synthase
MSTTKKTWAEAQAQLENAIGTAQGVGIRALELLKFSDTNRRLTSAQQAKIGALIELQYNVLLAHSELNPEAARVVWGWLPAIKTTLEKYQFTISDKQDTRNEFLEALMYEAKAQAKDNKNSISIESGGKSED